MNAKPLVVVRTANDNMMRNLTNMHRLLSDAYVAASRPLTAASQQEIINNLNQCLKFSRELAGAADLIDTSIKSVDADIDAVIDSLRGIRSSTVTADGKVEWQERM